MNERTHFPMHNGSMKPLWKENSKSMDRIRTKCGKFVPNYEIDSSSEMPGCSKCRGVVTRELHRDEKGMLLDWSNYKSSLGSLSVRFPGGFCIYVISQERKSWKPSDRWMVWWGDEKEDQMPGLTNRSFASRRGAMLAAERIFVPIARVAKKLTSASTEISVDDVWKKKKRRR